MVSRSIFLEVSSLTPERIVSIVEDIRAHHRSGTDRVYNLVLTNIADIGGALYVAQLDALRPYMVGGALAACDNVFVGTRWLPWDWAKYGADPAQWYNHYAVWGGILNGQYRWDNLFYNQKVWKAFKERYALPWQHFYVSMEMDVGSLYHSALGLQIKSAYEAYLIQSCKDARVVESSRSVLWSPFHWDKFGRVTAAQRNELRVQLNSMMLNVKNLSGTAGINFLDLQDGLGARPGIVTVSDAAAAFSTVASAYPFASAKMNVEWYRATSSGFVADNASAREAEFLASGITTGAVWEGRYFKDAHSHGAVPSPSVPSIKFLSRSQWGANTNLPQLGFHVPPAVRTELHIHHTVALDGNDATPNRWSEAEAVQYMRTLQTARPDLGRDIPYTYVFFVLENLDILICEGRGLLRSGAHTAGHNTAGFGWAVAGNFDLMDDGAANAFLFAVGNEAKYLRTAGFPNLCSRKNPQGWDLWGHRDTAAKSCPGNTLYPKLGGVKVA